MSRVPYARAVQLLCCCRFDHRILFTALGTIQATATQAPNVLNSRSFTVATATPTDTMANAMTWRNTMEKHKHRHLAYRSTSKTNGGSWLVY